MTRAPDETRADLSVSPCDEPRDEPSNEQGSADRRPPRPLRASLRRDDSYLYGGHGRTFTAAPETTRQWSRRVSLPLTAIEWLEAARRGYCYLDDIPAEGWAA